jgi:arylsulfatase
MQADRPNILWITTDQQRYDTIAALGHTHMHTPHLDGLVRQGVAFARAYCQSPVCTPSRASFMTGRYASAVHQNRNAAAYFAPPYHDEPTLVTKVLSDAGYDCGLVGKLDLCFNRAATEPRSDDGFGYFQYSSRPDVPANLDQDYHHWLRAKGLDPAALLGRKSDARDAVTTFLPPSPTDDCTPAEFHQTTWCAEKAVEFIDIQRDGPWLLCLNIFYPHPPFDPPWEYYRRFDPATMPAPAFRDSDLQIQATLRDVVFQTDARPPQERNVRELRAAYYAMIELVDERIGTVFDHLQRSGQWQNTVIVFTSDHGDMLGDHGLTRKGCRFYDSLTRVPLLWSWPGRFRHDLISDALVELTDIAPTLLEIAGLDTPRGMQGRSLLSILEGRASPDRHRGHVRSEYYDGQQGGKCFFGTMYRDERWKLVIYHGHPVGELYDMQDDPREFDNLWEKPDYQDVQHRLMRASFDATVMAMDTGPPLLSPDPNRRT